MREQLITPENVQRVRTAPQLTLYPFRGSIYTYLCFNFRASDDTTKPKRRMTDPLSETGSPRHDE